MARLGNPAPYPAPRAPIPMAARFTACASFILLKANWRSYNARPAGENPGTGTCVEAGGGRGVEAVPGGVGLLPHEHCKISIYKIRYQMSHFSRDFVL